MTDEFERVLTKRRYLGAGVVLRTPHKSNTGWLPYAHNGHGVPNMIVDDFHQSLTSAKPPAELTLAVAGLWWDAKGDWTRAHELAQQDEGRDGSWVHAYLHRKEGDQSNAVYWYRRAGNAFCP